MFADSCFSSSDARIASANEARVDLDADNASYGERNLDVSIGRRGAFVSSDAVVGGLRVERIGRAKSGSDSAGQ